MSIQRLPGSVVAKIKSSIVVTSLNQVACELVKNSLDAGATTIKLTLDYTRGNCSVEDDGDGIPAGEFKEDGGLAKLHYTSKYPPSNKLYGGRGELLAAVAALSLLSVTSHQRGKRMQNSLQVHNSTVIARHVPALPEQRMLTFDYGTRVTVRDLFGSMPVRVKQRPQSASAVDALRDWNSLLRNIAALLLSWPKNVTLKLHCAGTGQTISIRTGNDPHMVLRSSSRVPAILWQAGLLESPTCDKWVPLSGESNGICVQGSISLDPAPSKKFQFISIGLHPLLNEFGNCIIHQEVNKLFSSSGFGIEEIDDFNDVEKERRSKDRRYKTDALPTTALSTRRGVDRWPMFYLQIHVDTAESAATKIDEALDARGPTLHLILELVNAMVYEFLKRNNFRPHKPRTRKAGPRDKPGNLLNARHQSQKASCLNSPFSFWTKAKSGQSASHFKRVESSKVDASSRPTSGPQVTCELVPLVRPDGQICRPPFAEYVETSVAEPIRPTIEQPSMRDGEFFWENPMTHVKTLVDNRTGFVRTPTDKPERVWPSRDILQSNLESGKLTQKPSATWIDAILRTWKNPVFERPSESEVPRLARVGELEAGCGDAAHLTPMLGSGAGLAKVFEMATLFLESRVSKAVLKNAEVLAQIDRKFILIKIVLPGPRSKTAAPGVTVVVIVDQHAADERRRLEALMRDYHDNSEGRAVVAPIDPGIYFDVSNAEARLFDQSKNWFLRWGIKYHVVHTTAKPTHTFNNPPDSRRHKALRTVVIVGLPPSIAERCKLEPRLIINLLRKELHSMDAKGDAAIKTSAGPSLTQPQDSGDNSWIVKFHGCPRGILDMINSRACRSAIMFNDPLTIAECQELISGLASCALPFQCAHGRPSMIPLIGFGNLEDGPEDAMVHTSDAEKIMDLDEQLLGCKMIID